MNFASVLVISATVVILFSLLDKAFSIPDVHFSYSTNECVKVLNYVEGENYSCENLPRKFNHVWVQ